MKTFNIASELKFVNQIGCTISTEERLNLELLLMSLSETENKDEILFWGKIEGTQKSYYIAVSRQYRNRHDFPCQQLYYT